MRFWPRTAIAIVAAAVVVTPVAGGIWWILSSKNPVNAATILGGILAPVAIAVGLLAALGKWWWKGTRSTAEAGTAARLAEAVDRLAAEAQEKWRDEAGRRRIGTPVSAKIWWRWAEVSAPRSEVTTPPAPGLGPPALPDSGTPRELLGSGEVIRLHNEVYARLPHGRLVLLGRPGAGKTATMLLLLLAELDARARLTGEQRVRIPVPVWLTLGRWDPATMTLREWTVLTMNREYPHLRAPAYGPDAAGELLRHGLVALFLDGLDEMPQGARARALQRVGDETAGLRIVITSRPGEYQDALVARPADSTAVIELRPVRPKQASEYLLHGQTGRARRQWEQVGDYLTKNPDSVAALALDNPLTLSLARDAYGQDPAGPGKDPVELTDPARFATVEEVREHLFDRFLVTAYPKPEQRAHATRWLAWIAHHMATSQDLAWWDIPAWIPRWKLRLTRGLVTGLTVGLAYGLGFGLANGLQYGLASGFGSGLIGLAAGFVLGLAFGLVPPLRTRPAGAPPEVASRPRVRRRRGVVPGLIAGLVMGSWLGAVTADTGGGPGTGAFAGLVEGLVFGILVWTGVRSWPRLESALKGAPRTLIPRWPQRRELGPILMIGILAFPLLIPALLAMWATPIADSPSATAVGIYRADRRTSVIYGLVYGVPFGLVSGWAIGLAAGRAAGQEAGLAAGLAAGLGAGLIIVSGFAAAGWFVAGQVPVLKLAELFLSRHRRNRINFLGLLEDAFDRQVLRQAGAAYQFRHAALQVHLARMYDNVRSTG